MNRGTFLASAGLCALLAGCGGGSGQVASTPPPPVVKTNTSLANLQYSQSFTNDAAGIAGTWDLTTKTVVSGTASSTALTVSYDAQTNGYTVSGAGQSETFLPTDSVKQDTNDTQYKKPNGASNDYLTLISTPYSGKNQTQYVRMGYWQHNSSTATSQDVNFEAFSYGLPTDAAAVARTGSAAYGIDVFGLVSAPGHEPTEFQGSGQFSVDFAAGTFTTQADVTENGLVTGSGSSGGGIEMRAAGSLTSGSGNFTGNAVYGSSFGQTSGTIAGRFYGPAGQELGAAFQTAGANGVSAVGAVTGKLDGTLAAANQSFADISHEQLFYTQSDYSVGQLDWLNSQTFTYSPPISNMAGGQFGLSDKVASADPNFTTYKKTFNLSGYGSQDVVLQLYNPGSQNTELALTYVSFGHWAGTTGGNTQDDLFLYGFMTGPGLLAARTGTGHYQGVVYGTGNSSDGVSHYDVKGTSTFDVDFGASSLTGALTMSGTERVSGATASFGTVNASGPLSYNKASFQATLMQNGASTGGNLSGSFYGPNAEEIGATFGTVVTGGSSGSAFIQGVTVAHK